MEQYLKNFKNCLQKEIPYCAAECPFRLDILDFIEKMKRGGFQGAFKTYRNAVGFPMIVSNLCHEPCKSVCPRKEIDGSVELRKLEKACIDFAADKSPMDYNIPKKMKKVAIVGAGPSGLACLLRLCMKKYEVEVFEAAGRIGGSLWDLLDPEVFLTDVQEQLKHETYTLHLNTRVHTVEDLADKGFDAVYAATGAGGMDFGLLDAVAETGDRYCVRFENTGWFAGGGLVGDSTVYALANGLHMGTVIDNFLKTDQLLYPENRRNTGMCLNPAKLSYMEPVKASCGENYHKEEAQQEAGRCIECQCDFCRTYCDLTDFYHKWPLRIRDEVMATTLPGSADIKATPAKRLMSTCNQCGLCKETCPEDIDLGGLILAGRKSMHQQKKAPWVFHDFWLRDMDFANSEHASIVKAGGKYAFFPGCQLGASDPELVRKVYSFLRSAEGKMGLLLHCCGAPAEWSGDEEKHQREITNLTDLWKEMGRPTLILACPTCEKKFQTYLPEIPVASLYEVLDDNYREQLQEKLRSRDTIKPSAQDALQQSGEEGGKPFSVFDPCAARHETDMKAAVRNLAELAGYRLEPLPGNDAFARCCSFGGQPGIANPEYAQFVAQKRISESDNPYITYCINCRDIFLDAGKEAVHILDLLFGCGKGPSHLPTVTQRRENRIRLKNGLLREYWAMESAGPAGKKKLPERNVLISPELAKKLSDQKILEEEILEVLDFCERTGRRVFSPERNTYSGYRETGYMTCWVEYKINIEEAYELINAYAHRVRIELEPVWNGRKQTKE